MHRNMRAGVLSSPAFKVGKSSPFTKYVSERKNKIHALLSVDDNQPTKGDNVGQINLVCRHLLASV
jgi:hypothetical protein